MDKYEIKLCLCGRCPEVLNPKVKNLKEGVWIRRAHSSVNHLPVRLHISSLFEIFAVPKFIISNLWNERRPLLPLKILGFKDNVPTLQSMNVNHNSIPGEIQRELGKKFIKRRNGWQVCFDHIVLNNWIICCAYSPLTLRNLEKPHFSFSGTWAAIIEVAKSSRCSLWT